MSALAFIDTKVKEGSFQEDFADILSAGGWSIAKTFYKIAYPDYVIDPEYLSANFQPYNIIPINVAKHVILENSNPAFSKTFLGVAMRGVLSPRWDSLSANKPVNAVSPEQSAGFTEWVKGQVEALEDEDDSATKFFTSSELYFYIVEKIPSVAGESWNTIPFTSGALEQGCLDVEVWKAYYKQVVGVGGSSYKFTIVEPELVLVQSPITKCTTRYASPPLESLYNVTFDVVETRTNWWADSDISVIGYIDNDAAFFVLQADVVPAWEDNVVPSIPFYLGRIRPFENDEGELLDYDAVAFFAGTAPSGAISEIPMFDFTNYDKSKYQKTLMPILKDYPRHPSNGVDTVTVHRARRGARYQAYFLSWNSSLDDILPSRSERHNTDFTSDTFDRQYPRAWQHPESDEYLYCFNPSRYSDKIHTSRIYVMHPEEGLVGHLYHAIGMASIGITSGKVRVIVDPCSVDRYEYYKYMVVDGVSPLTKRPGTVYRPIGLGILDDTPII